MSRCTLPDTHHTCQSNICDRAYHHRQHILRQERAVVLAVEDIGNGSRMVEVIVVVKELLDGFRVLEGVERSEDRRAFAVVCRSVIDEVRRNRDIRRDPRMSLCMLRKN